MDRDENREAGNRPAPAARSDGESGAAMVEFAIVFPLQLLVFLLGLQLCLIVMGKMMVNYSAFCAARSYIVGRPKISGTGSDLPQDVAEIMRKKAEDAAAIALIPVGGMATDGETFEEVILPGWEGSDPDFGILSRRSREKVDVEVLEGMNRYGVTTNPRVVLEVHFAFEMMIPLANWVIFYGLDAMNPGLVHFKPVNQAGTMPDQSIGVLIGGVPHIVLTERGVMPSYQHQAFNHWQDPPHEIRTDPEEP